MSGPSSSGTARRYGATGSPTRPATDMAQRLGGLILRWRTCRDYWRLREGKAASPAEVSACRANQAAYTAALDDLSAVMRGDPLPERTDV